MDYVRQSITVYKHQLVKLATLLMYSITPRLVYFCSEQTLLTQLRQCTENKQISFLTEKKEVLQLCPGSRSSWVKTVQTRNQQIHF